MNRSRQGSASSETMQDIVLLQDELSKSKIENQKLNNQLACLISLVRKAWTGDKESAVHVANIVGVAPPDLNMEEIDGSKVALTAKPKPQALNHWARLTIGLLNRQYKQLEDDLQIHQYQYLEDRNDYLNDQIYEHQQMMTRPNTANRNRYQDVMDRIMRPQRPPTATAGSIERPVSGTVNKKKGVIGHLYRQPKPPDSQNDVTWGDLFINGGKSPSQKTNVKTFEFRPVNHHNYSSFTPDTDQYSYNDPDRYSKVDLFALDSILSESNRKVSNLSQKTLQNNDNKRSRPKSSVIIRPKSGRPLKYETTRPVTSHPGNRVHFKADDETDHNTPPSGVTRKQRAQSAITRTRPVEIDEFEQDQENLATMEEQFRNTAFQLQKKIGIRDNGLVL
ncbi:uncharacterized protein LOC141902340 [Tubulanus polymorphus]|uniref:uncharacterized protein LOC141902340 n=1 Tax=Tubulanus polymorphus TaxID=672921 RepID=UPI003DA571A1